MTECHRPDEEEPGRLLAAATLTQINTMMF